MAHDDRLLAAPLREHLRSLEEARRADWHRYPAQVSRAAAYIHSHLFDRGLNAAGVRSGCGVRNHNLTTQFHRVVGVTLRDYIETLRLHVAAHLLCTVPTEAFWIAEAVGYESYETFCRAFRRHFHCTPSEFRVQPRGR